MTQKPAAKRIIMLLVSLLAALTVVAALSGQNTAMLSWGVMALSLGLTIIFIIQNNRKRYKDDRKCIIRGAVKDVGGLLLSTAAAIVAGQGVVRLAQNWLTPSVWWGVMVCLVLSFAVGLGAASLVRAGWKKLVRG